MNNIDNILNSFESVSLKQIDSVKLLNRMDTKYLLERDELEELFLRFQDSYYVLKIKKVKISSYKTAYFDTDDFICYYLHQFGRANRFKIRIRRYLDSHKTFLEVKVKNNHDKTKKSRIEIKDDTFVLDSSYDNFIDNKIGKDNSQFKQALWVYYSRITLVNKEFTERMTIDTDLRFEGNGKTKSFSDIVILELKQDKKSFSKANSVLQDMKIFQSSLSKYCLGIASLYPVKTNNINEKIRLINKLSYEKV